MSHESNGYDKILLHILRCVLEPRISLLCMEEAQCKRGILLLAMLRKGLRTLLLTAIFLTGTPHAGSSLLPAIAAGAFRSSSRRFRSCSIVDVVDTGPMVWSGCLWTGDRALACCISTIHSYGKHRESQFYTCSSASWICMCSHQVRA